MRLQTSATQIDFYPVGTGKRFVQRTIWHPGSEEMTVYCTIVKSEMIYKVNNYIANGATVLDFNLEEIPSSEYSPMMCWLIMIALPNPTRMITFMETFKVILSLQSNPDKFTFTTIEDCSDMDECIEFIHDEFPLHNIESIRRIPQ